MKPYWMAFLPILALASPPAEAVNRPDLVGYALLSSDVIALGETVTVDLEMENIGTKTATNAFMNMLLPSGVGYTVRAYPRGGTCSASRVGSQMLFICMVTVRPGGVATLSLNVTPGAVGDYTFYATADPANSTRELDETNNIDSVVLSVE